MAAWDDFDVIGAPLGVGITATVYRAVRKSDGLEVALKRFCEPVTTLQLCSTTGYTSQHGWLL